MPCQPFLRFLQGDGICHADVHSPPPHDRPAAAHWRRGLAGVRLLLLPYEARTWGSASLRALSQAFSHSPACGECGRGFYAAIYARRSAPLFRLHSGGGADSRMIAFSMLFLNHFRLHASGVLACAPPRLAGLRAEWERSWILTLQHVALGPFMIAPFLGADGICAVLRR